MQYISFARKYRPKIFADLIGQEVLTKTLEYEISNNQLVSSFLFTGIRGIGKTTCARIVAQTINCSKHQNIGGMIAPCMECNNCLAFQDSSHPDVIEVDAASYTSVDNIRDIIEKALYKPILGQYKVFIIDEVHMLSKSAFNALLKTLEEPPSHVIFILLTTEISKVPITILSRCQKFNLKRLNIENIITLLEKICKNQNINYTTQALEAIAYKADGSARDATVLLEQSNCLAQQKNSTLDIEIIKESLDLNNYKYALDLVEFITDQNAKAILDLTHELHNQNIDFLNLISAINELIALLCKLKLIKDTNIGFFKTYDPKIRYISDNTDLGFLTSLWQIFTKGSNEVANSQNQLISFEMLIIKAIYCSLLPPIQELDSDDSSDDDNQSITKNPESNPKALLLSTKSEITTPNTDKTKLAQANHDQPKPSKIAQAQVLEETLDEEKLFAFISYTHQKQFFELYHFMMNECEVISFGNSRLKITGPKFSDQTKKQLLNILQDWDKNNWQIAHNINSVFCSIQTKLKNQAQSDRNFKDIISIFPGTSISDIWLNFLKK